MWVGNGPSQPGPDGGTVITVVLGLGGATSCGDSVIRGSVTAAHSVPYQEGVAQPLLLDIANNDLLPAGCRCRGVPGAPCGVHCAGCHTEREAVALFGVVRIGGFFWG